MGRNHGGSGREIQRKRCNNGGLKKSREKKTAIEKRREAAKNWPGSQKRSLQVKGVAET